VLEQVVAEDADPGSLLPGLQGAAPKPVLHWWPHLLMTHQHGQFGYGSVLEMKPLGALLTSSVIRAASVVTQTRYCKDCSQLCALLVGLSIT